MTFPNLNRLIARLITKKSINNPSNLTETDKRMIRIMLSKTFTSLFENYSNDQLKVFERDIEMWTSILQDDEWIEDHHSLGPLLGLIMEVLYTTAEVMDELGIEY